MECKITEQIEHQLQTAKRSMEKSKMDISLIGNERTEVLRKKVIDVVENVTSLLPF